MPPAASPLTGQSERKSGMNGTGSWASLSEVTKNPKRLSKGQGSPSLAVPHDAQTWMVWSQGSRIPSTASRGSASWRTTPMRTSASLATGGAKQKKMKGSSTSCLKLYPTNTITSQSLSTPTSITTQTETAITFYDQDQQRCVCVMVRYG